MEEPFKGTAAWTTVQPDGDLVAGILVLRGEEPEIKLRSLVCLITDRKKTGIGLSNVKVDVWDGSCSAIDGELCTVLDDVPNHREEATHSWKPRS